MKRGYGIPGVSSFKLLGDKEKFTVYWNKDEKIFYDGRNFWLYSPRGSYHISVPNDRDMYKRGVIVEELLKEGGLFDLLGDTLLGPSVHECLEKVVDALELEQIELLNSGPDYTYSFSGQLVCENPEKETYESIIKSYMEEEEKQRKKGLTLNPLGIKDSSRRKALEEAKKRLDESVD